MTHEYEGHYTDKHPEGTTHDASLAAALKVRAQDDRVTCAEAHELAKSFGVPPSEVGKTADLLELRIAKCQLGLFGYPPKGRIVEPAEEISDVLRDQLQRLATNERIGCATCWKIAGELDIEKMAVSSACEHLGIKVKHCQLGTF
ncbi:MAG: hypothetical protein GXY46_02835 [Actinobacteria bacterium]|nr:hypothetical protein [Actinomycetota bacterium]